MASKNHLNEYVSRLVHQTLVQLTGGLGFILAAILELIFPGAIIKWVFYLILLIAGLVVGGYQVFVEIVKEHAVERNNLAQHIDTLKVKLRGFEEKQPHISVQLLDNNSHSTNRLLIALNHLPPAPSLEDEIAKKRNELLAKKRSKPIELDSRARIVFEGLDLLNPDYDREVEEYLPEYKDYLIEKYECSIANDRLRGVELIAENLGLYPATDITIELAMPEGYRMPSEKQLLAWKYAEIGQVYTPSPPQEPSFSLGLLGSRLRDIGLGGISIFNLDNDYHGSEPTNTSGPDVSSVDGINLITYQIRKLIQNRPERNLRLLPVWLGDVSASITWEITVKVYAAELPIPLTDSLWIDLKIQDEKPSKN